MLNFFDTIKNDETALYSADISIITFSGYGEKCIRDFSDISTKAIPPVITTSGHTPMGEAINLSLDMLEKRKDEYKKNGVDYYQPWLVIMSDGEPNGDPYELDKAIQRTNELVNLKKLSVFAIGIGEDADMDVLAKISPKRKPLKLKGLNFSEFFVWLSQSVVAVSQSMPGDTVKLDIDGLESWAEI